MSTQTLNASRNILMQVMTAVGIGLFVLIGIRAIRQIEDKQYLVGKQRTTGLSAVSSGQPSFVQSAALMTLSTLSTVDKPTAKSASVTGKQDTAKSHQNPYPEADDEKADDKNDIKKSVVKTTEDNRLTDLDLNIENRNY